MLAIFAEHEFQTRTGSSRLRWSFLCWGVLFLLGAFSTVQGKDAHSTFDVKVSGRGPAIILIPGLSCSGMIWEETVKHLQDRFECHVLSLKGFGETAPSQPLPSPLLPKVRDEIIAYARTLGHPVLVGHSLGGVLAMEVAANAPDLPRSLVIVDSTPFLAGGFGAQPDSVATIVHTIREKMEGMTKEEFSSVQTLAIRTMVNSEEQAGRLADLANRSDQATVIQALSELIRTDLREDLARITCPVVVVLAGINTASLSGDGQTKIREQYAALAGAKILFFERARHFVMYDEPVKFREVLDAALAGS